VFLFGAGASRGSGDCSPECPPLGNRLFPELLKRKGFAATFDEELRGLFGDFEKGMERFIETREIDIPKLLREMSEYFLQFEPGPDNLYVQLLQQLNQRQANLAEAAPRIMLATTNYELLLEHSVLDAGGAVVYPDPDSKEDFGIARVAFRGGVKAPVPREGPPWVTMTQEIAVQYPAYKVLKLHGSCNFLPAIDPESIRGVTFLSNRGANMNVPALPLYPPDLARDYLERSDASIAPAIAMYAVGKRVLYSNEYVGEHQRRFQAAVEEADKIFLIGIRIWPQDKHIWDHIAASNARIGYVGFEADDFSDWCEENGRTNDHFLARTFEEALPLIEQELEPGIP
jgi:hypothetical protein